MTVSCGGSYTPLPTNHPQFQVSCLWNDCEAKARAECEQCAREEAPTPTVAPNTPTPTPAITQACSNGVSIRYRRCSAFGGSQCKACPDDPNSRCEYRNGKFSVYYKCNPNQTWKGPASCSEDYLRCFDKIAIYQCGCPIVVSTPAP